MFISPVMSIMDAKEWVATPCVVERSELQTHTGDDSTTYEVDILYRYEFNGRTYRSNRYWFASSSSNYDVRDDIVDRHEPGTETTCYVNPDNPSQAVIDRRWKSEMWFGLFPLIFVLVGLGGLVGVPVYRLRQAGRRDTTRQWLPDSGDEGGAAAQTGAVAFDDTETAGSVTLRPTLRRWGKLAGMIVFALFWNGIVSVFVYQVVTGHMEGDPSWFLTIFMIPFVLVGLGVIGGVVYNALAVFNPVVELTVNTKQPALGETLNVDWRIDGAGGRLQSLKITLTGEERATYQRGTNTVTDEKQFAEIPLVDEHDRQKIRAGRGSASAAIPTDTMHTFEARRNEIRWKLVVHGDVPRWPDVKDEYTLTLRPRPVA